MSDDQLPEKASDSNDESLSDAKEESSGDTSVPEETAPEIETLEPTTSEPEATADSQSSESSVVEDVPPSQPQPQSNASSVVQPKPSRKGGLLLWVGLLGIASAGGYVAYEGQQIIKSQSNDIAVLKQQLEARASSQQKSIDALAITQQQNAKKFDAALREARTGLTDTNQRLSVQGKRLRALTDTSREDWLLAEAEYLLKLANQRVRIERSPVGAQALLEEADNILRDLDDPSLHPLRRAIAQDLAALKLLNTIDVEGIYLSLLALTDQVTNIPVQLSPTELEQASSDSDITNESGFFNVVGASWSRFTGSFKDYIRVVPHKNKPKPLLPIQDEVYLQQNLRLMLERAQLALLRGQQEVYSQSLSRADNWVATYYNESGIQQNFRAELQRLGKENVVQELPDISQSLNLLHEYIEDLHNLKSSRVPTAKKVKKPAKKVSAPNTPKKASAAKKQAKPQNTSSTQTAASSKSTVTPQSPTSVAPKK